MGERSSLVWTSLATFAFLPLCPHPSGKVQQSVSCGIFGDLRNEKQIAYFGAWGNSSSGPLLFYTAFAVCFNGLGPNRFLGRSI